MTEAESKLQELLRRRRNKRVAMGAAAAGTGLALAWMLLASPWQIADVDPAGMEPPGHALPWQADEPGEALAPVPAPREAPVPRVAEAPPPARPLTPPTDLPALEASDGFVRRSAAALAEHPEFARWLVGEDLAARFVAAVDNVAEGLSPRPHARVLAPPGRFRVQGSEDDLDGFDLVFVDPASYTRYDALGSVIDALDPRACASLYSMLSPLLQQAYVELGYPDGSFALRLREAAEELLGAPLVPERPALRPKVRRFEYEDPTLEGLSDARKHLLRMGPRNMGIVQRKLRAVMREIDPAWTAPGTTVYRAKRPPEPAQAGSAAEREVSESSS